jgi:hypothetical protein
MLRAGMITTDNIGMICKTQHYYKGEDLYDWFIQLLSFLDKDAMKHMLNQFNGMTNLRCSSKKTSIMTHSFQYACALSHFHKKDATISIIPSEEGNDVAFCVSRGKTTRLMRDISYIWTIIVGEGIVNTQTLINEHLNKYPTATLEQIITDWIKFSNVSGTYDNLNLTQEPAFNNGPLAFINWITTNPPKITHNPPVNYPRPVNQSYKPYDFTEAMKQAPTKTNVDFTKIKQLCKNSFLVQGGAGSGKTYLSKKCLLHLWKKAKKQNKKVVGTGFTHKTISVLENQTKVFFKRKAKEMDDNIIFKTLHSLCGLGTGEDEGGDYSETNKKPKYKIDPAELYAIVIDKFSHLSHFLLSHIDTLKQENPQLIVILLGDIKQCPPVDITETRLDIFNSSVLYSILGENGFICIKPYNASGRRFLHDYTHGELDNFHNHDNLQQCPNMKQLYIYTSNYLQHHTTTFNTYK